jgi:hypothetical protein
MERRGGGRTGRRPGGDRPVRSRVIPLLLGLARRRGFGPLIIWNTALLIGSRIGRVGDATTLSKRAGKADACSRRRGGQRLQTGFFSSDCVSMSCGQLCKRATPCNRVVFAALFVSALPHQAGAQRPFSANVQAQWHRIKVLRCGWHSSLLTPKREPFAQGLKSRCVAMRCATASARIAHRPRICSRFSAARPSISSWVRAPIPRT